MFINAYSIAFLCILSERPQGDLIMPEKDLWLSINNIWHFDLKPHFMTSMNIQMSDLPRTIDKLNLV